MQSTFKTLALPLTLALALSACGDKPQEQQAEAPLAPPQPPAGYTITGVSGTYELDPRHTDVIAQWNHFGFSNPSVHFGQIEGRIVFDADNIAASSVEATIPLAGLEAYVQAFNEHLRTVDFFDAAAFPVVTFKSTEVEVSGNNRLKVTGDLTIKDVTQSAVLDVSINGFGEHPMSKRPTAGFDAYATIKRSDFGMGAYAPHVSDEVRLRITTEAPAPAEDAPAGD